jgi:hypothetical protein
VILSSAALSTGTLPTHRPTQAGVVAHAAVAAVVLEVRTEDEAVYARTERAPNEARRLASRADAHAILARLASSRAVHPALTAVLRVRTQVVAGGRGIRRDTRLAVFLPRLAADAAPRHAG